MAITKFTDIADTGYDVAINRDAINQTERDKFLAGLVTKIDELTDLLNNHITDMATNNAKTTFPGFGTSSTTALVGDTTTISKAQDSAITANTAKTSMSLGTSGTTALAGDTKLIDIGLHTTLSFGDLTETINKGKATYTILLSATRDFGGKTGVLTKSSIITLM